MSISLRVQLWRWFRFRSFQGFAFFPGPAHHCSVASLENPRSTALAQRRLHAPASSRLVGSLGFEKDVFCKYYIYISTYICLNIDGERSMCLYGYRASMYAYACSLYLYARAYAFIIFHFVFHVL